MTSTPPVKLRSPRKSEFEEMRAGHLYDASDPQIAELMAKSSKLCKAYNAAASDDEKAQLMDELLGGHGEGCTLVGPVAFDYGCNTTFGDRVYANYNFTVLDCAPVTIGDDVLFGPGVSLLTAMHPMRWQDRNVRRRPNGEYYDYEYAKPITIGSNCWFGGNVTVLGGVTIGAGSVIGAGAVATRDIPENSVAVGTPARVIRTITDADAAVNQEYAQ